MTSLIALSPAEVVTRMHAEGASHAFIAHDRASATLRASHAFLDELEPYFATDESGFAGHEGVFLGAGPETGALFGAFVYSTTRGMAQGGLRHVPYDTFGDFLRDGLRLSQAMARKSALAGLWWGGGKGVIARQPGDAWHDRAYRDQLYAEYGAFVSGLRGCFAVAEDAGTNTDDMAAVFRTTRFVTCIPPAMGGSGNPSTITALGVVVAMEAVLDEQAGGSLAGKRIAMQGTGNVGSAMIGYLLDRGVGSVVASDIDPDRIATMRDRFAGKPVELRLVERDDASILFEQCDILAPNGLGGVLNPATIPGIRAPIVCGAANNQLADEDRDSEAIAARGITFVPDFVCNRMGIVNCANEQYGYPEPDPAIERHLGHDWENGIYQTVRRMLQRAAAEGVTASEAAIALADELAAIEHPIWPGRGQQIISSLVHAGGA